jgi:cell wall-associated NlpC family hydrolase
MGNVLELLEIYDEWFMVRLCDGSEGYLEKKTASMTDEFCSSMQRIERIVATVKKMAGTPYIWGGNTPRGFDCSGLIQFCFRMGGKLTPRDCRDQFRIGHSVSLEEIRKGDLLFFGTGEEPTHVALHTEGLFYHHARGTVKRASLDPECDLYDYELASIVMGSRRVIDDTSDLPVLSSASPG